jgi:hypothetical protein
MTNQEYANGLRAAADFYENQAEIATPHEHVVTNYSVHSKKDAAAVIRALGACDKNYTVSQLQISKEIAPGFSLRFVFSRDQVCERVVVATKVIPEHTLPASEETVVPARVEEIVEWRCGSILEGQAA